MLYLKVTNRQNITEQSEHFEFTDNISASGRRLRSYVRVQLMGCEPDGSLGSVVAKLREGSLHQVSLELSMAQGEQFQIGSVWELSRLEPQPYTLPPSVEPES